MGRCEPVLGLCGWAAVASPLLLSRACPSCVWGADQPFNAQLLGQAVLSRVVWPAVLINVGFHESDARGHSFFAAWSLTPIISTF